MHYFLVIYIHFMYIYHNNSRSSGQCLQRNRSGIRRVFFSSLLPDELMYTKKFQYYATTDAPVLVCHWSLQNQNKKDCTLVEALTTLQRPVLQVSNSRRRLLVQSCLSGVGIFKFKEKSKIGILGLSLGAIALTKNTPLHAPDTGLFVISVL